MGKRILFVLCRAGIGGSCVSLINLLKLLKTTEYDIDVFLMEGDGQFTHRIAAEANLLKCDTLLEAVTMKVSNLVEGKKYWELILRACYSCTRRIFGDARVIDFIYRRTAKKFKGYDTAIGFQEETTTYFTSYIQCVNKIAWVHNNLETFVNHSGIGVNRDAYEKYSHIVCVSYAAARSIEAGIPSVSDKTIVIHNPQDIKTIREKSMAATTVELIHDGNYIFLSVGRFSEQKAFERIPEVANLLKEDDLRFHWYIVGNGNLLGLVKEKIDMHDVGDCVHLTGALDNPYPIIKLAHCLVVTSLYEANPMVVSEALILHTPVITTNYDSAPEVVQDGVTGLICENSVEGIYKCLKDIITNDNLFLEIANGARKYRYRNDAIIEKVIEIL